MQIKLIIILFCAAVSLSNTNHNRYKRKILFTKNSKLFFRLNGKENVIPWTTTFAHGWAFRMNFELPETLLRRHKFFKRDVVGEYQDFKNVESYSCVLKNLCEFINTIRKSNTCGSFCEIGKIVLRSHGADVDFFKVILDECHTHIKNCLYTFTDNTYFLNKGFG